MKAILKNCKLIFSPVKEKWYVNGYSGEITTRTYVNLFPNMKNISVGTKFRVTITNTDGDATSESNYSLTVCSRIYNSSINTTKNMITQSGNIALLYGNGIIECEVVSMPEVIDTYSDKASLICFVVIISDYATWCSFDYTIEEIYEYSE